MLLSQSYFISSSNACSAKIFLRGLLEEATLRLTLHLCESIVSEMLNFVSVLVLYYSYWDLF